jgi:NAD(P)-dependent dehydrogenase (short-subunit alcohol dehydrogenase family)
MVKSVELNGRTALVAGGTGHVGAHLTRELLLAGARVVVPSRSAEKLRQLRETLARPLGERLIGLEGDVSNPKLAVRVREQAEQLAGGPIDAVVASLGGFVAAESVLSAPLEDLERAVRGYLYAHFVVAGTFLPHLADRGGAYVSINGPLAWHPSFPGTGLVSIASAAQAMLAKVLMQETAGTKARINEVVLYSAFGWGDAEKRNTVTGEDIGRYIAFLVSDAGSEIRGQTLHLKTPADLVDTDARSQHVRAL